MTRAARVSIELFAPPLLGSSPLLLMTILAGTLGMIPMVLLVAYLVAIVPSMVFTLVLELAFWRALDPRSPGAILLAGSLGLASGVAMGLLPGGPTAAEHAFVLGLIGTVAGAGTGTIVWWKSAPTAAEALPPSASTTT